MRKEDKNENKAIGLSFFIALLVGNFSATWLSWYASLSLSGITFFFLWYICVICQMFAHVYTTKDTQPTSSEYWTVTASPENDYVPREKTS